MIYQQMPNVWKHVAAVRESDQASPLRPTPLRHIQLNGVSKMKSKLAYDIFDRSVQTHMQQHNLSQTEATRQYLCQCETFLTVFQSSKALAVPHNERLI